MVWRLATGWRRLPYFVLIAELGLVVRAGGGSRGWRLLAR